MVLIVMNPLPFLTRFWKRRIRSLTTAAAVTSLPALLIIRRLRAADALTPTTARPYRPQSFEEEVVFLRLLRAGIIREATPGRYFLNPNTGNDAAA